jgi:hypothetical protein
MGQAKGLSGKQWKRVSIHQVILAWLRAERATNLRTKLLLPEAVWKLAVDPLLDSADLNDPEENRARLRFMYQMRNIFFTEIPLDTEWHEVRGDVPSKSAVSRSSWIAKLTLRVICDCVSFCVGIRDESLKALIKRPAEAVTHQHAYPYCRRKSPGQGL